MINDWRDHSTDHNGYWINTILLYRTKPGGNDRVIRSRMLFDLLTLVSKVLIG